MSIQYTNNWFKEAVPVSKITRQSQTVQVGCHLEEVVEMLQEFEVPGFETDVQNAKHFLHVLAEIMKKNPEAFIRVTNRKAFLDACADQLVTATGSAYMQGMNIVGALDEVNRSNYSKFVDGKAVFNEHGKIAKGPNYTKPDLSPFVGVDPV